MEAKTRPLCVSSMAIGYITIYNSKFVHQSSYVCHSVFAIDKSSSIIQDCLVSKPSFITIAATETLLCWREFYVVQKRPKKLTRYVRDELSSNINTPEDIIKRQEST